MRNEGEMRRDLGMSRVQGANDEVDPFWRGDTLKIFQQAADHYEYVYPDLLRELGAREPARPNAWGPLWKKAIKEGWIEEAPNMRRKSARPPAHAKKMTVYKSRLYL